MKLLSRSEEIVLVAILKLRDNAYGVTRETGSLFSMPPILITLIISILSIIFAFAIMAAFTRSNP